MLRFLMLFLLSAMVGLTTCGIVTKVQQTGRKSVSSSHNKTDLGITTPEARATPSLSSVDHRSSNLSEAHKVSNLTGNSIHGKDHAERVAKARLKMKSPKDSTRHKNLSKETLDNVDVNSGHFHGPEDDHSSDLHSDHKSPDLLHQNSSNDHDHIEHDTPDHDSDHLENSLDDHGHVSNSFGHNGNVTGSKTVLETPRSENHLDIAHDSVIASLNASSSYVNDSTKYSNHSITVHPSSLQQNDSMYENSADVPKGTNSLLQIMLGLRNDSLDAPKTTTRTPELLNPIQNNKKRRPFTTSANIPPSSKLFLSIHNSFMKLNRTERLKSIKSYGASLRNATKSESRNLPKTNGELLKKSPEENIAQNFKLSENHDDVFNESKDVSSIHNTHTDTNLNSTNAMPLIQKRKSKLCNGNLQNCDLQETQSSDAKNEVNSSMPRKIVDHKIKVTKSESNDGTTSGAKNNDSQSLFSTLGLDFLINSELAKNAASAMDIFNFTDSALTDHIIDDQNDVHSLLELRTSVDNSSDGSHQSESVDSSTFDAASTAIAAADAASSAFVTDNSALDSHTPALIESSSVVYFSDILGKNSADEKGEFIKNHEQTLNSSSNILLPSTNNSINEERAPSQTLLNSTVEFEAVNKGQLVPQNASTLVVVECPPPGLCVLWFMAQDTCKVNSHCLGSRICCQIGCSKTCVEV